MDIFFQQAARRIYQNQMLYKVDVLIDWNAFSPILDKALGRSGIGPQGYSPVLLFKCLLLGQWFGLSDPKLERSLSLRIDFMMFCGLSLHSSVPDETTHCRFRNSLVKMGAFDDLLAEVCRQIEAQGLKMKHSEGAIIDATLITSAARPSKYIEVLQDEDGNEIPGEPEVKYSADPEASWVKKRNKASYGYRGHGRADKEGFIDKVHVTPANVSENPQFKTMIVGARADRILTDKGYSSRNNRDLLKELDYRDGILRKAARNRPLRPSEKRFNKLISKSRFRIEQCFGTMKRQFGLHRARYFGVKKAHAQMVMAAISQNLLKATNKIELTK